MNDANSTVAVKLVKAFYATRVTKDIYVSFTVDEVKALINALDNLARGDSGMSLNDEDDILWDSENDYDVDEELWESWSQLARGVYNGMFENMCQLIESGEIFPAGWPGTTNFGDGLGNEFAEEVGVLAHNIALIAAVQVDDPGIAVEVEPLTSRYSAESPAGADLGYAKCKPQFDNIERFESEGAETGVL